MSDVVLLPTTTRYSKTENHGISGTIHNENYVAIFDPFNLTSIGQQSLSLELSDISQDTKIAFILPRNPSTGVSATNIVMDTYFEKQSGSYVLSYSNYDRSITNCSRKNLDL